MNYRILVVDDEKPIADRIQNELNGNGIKIVVCYTYKNALNIIQSEIFDMIIMDLSIPDPGIDIQNTEGYSLLKEAHRQNDHVKCVIHSAFPNNYNKEMTSLNIQYSINYFEKNDNNQRLSILQLKEFVQQQILKHQKSIPEIYPLRNLQFNAYSGMLLNQDTGAKKELSGLPKDILEYLLINKNQFCEYMQIYNGVHSITDGLGGNLYDQEQTIKTAVKRLREQLALIGGHQETGYYICTKRGIGYKIND